MWQRPKDLESTGGDDSLWPQNSPDMRNQTRGLSPVYTSAI